MHDWSDVRAVVFDMDGVVYISNTLRRGMVALLALLDERTIDYRILTNRSIFTRQEISDNLAAMGLQFPAEKITTSSELAATYAHERLGADSVFTIGGSNGLRAALRDCKVKQIALEGLALDDIDRITNSDRQLGRPLIIGWSDEYNYEMATRVYRLGPAISQLCATGADRYFADEHGLMAGIVWLTGSVGSLLGKAVINPAKPSSFALDRLLRQVGQSAASTLIIGDSDSDMQMGNAAGCHTLLLLGGATSKTDLPHLNASCVPGQVIEELQDLL